MPRSKRDNVHDAGKEMKGLLSIGATKDPTLLTIENVSELIQLKSLLPSCMHCKKIRNDEGYWKDIAEYFNARLDVDFPHGLCHDCLMKHYPEMATRKSEKP